MTSHPWYPALQVGWRTRTDYSDILMVLGWVGVGGEAVLLDVHVGHVVLGAWVGVGTGRVLRVVFRV